MPEEERLIAELEDRDRESLEAQSALAHPQHSISVDGFQQLAIATELARGKVAAVRVRLRSLRAAKLRKKDSHDLHKLQNALNGLAEEIDAITYAGEAAKEHTPGLEASIAHQERFQHLEKIRDKLADLALVMDTNSEKRSPSRPNADVALQKLGSAQWKLGDVETHLNNAEGANADDAQSEIVSAKSSAIDMEDDLKAAKSALED